MHFSLLNIDEKFRCEDGFYFIRVKQIEGDIVTIKLYFRGKFLGVIHAVSHNNLQSMNSFPQRLGIRLWFEIYDPFESIAQELVGGSNVTNGLTKPLDLSILNRRDLKQHVFRVPYVPFNSLEITHIPWRNRAEVQLKFLNDILRSPHSLRSLELRKHSTMIAPSRFSTKFELISWTGDFVFPIRYYIYTELLPLLKKQFGSMPDIVEVFRNWVSETQ